MHLNFRSLAFVSSLVALLAIGASQAEAQGLHLRLSTETEQVGAEQPVQLKVAAVALRTFDLPGTPQFLVDDGSGLRPLAEAVRPLDAEGRVTVTPDKSFAGGYELTLDKPGTYKIVAEYKVDGRAVRSNKVTVNVAAAGSERASK